MGKHFRRRGRKALFERAGDLGVKLLAPGLEQGLVRGVLDQRMLEAVSRGGWNATTENQLGLDQLVKGGVELGLRQGRDRCKQIVAELPADDGADLGHF